VIVLDTNVVSELMRAEPHPALLGWLAEQRGDDICSTVITLAEIGYGLERLPHGRRREALLLAYADVFTAFDDKILDFDRAAAFRYGSLVAAREREGHQIDPMDAQIACIALAHEATLATRNEKDFDAVGLRVVNPWR
jgi:toxin FitB